MAGLLWREFKVLHSRIARVLTNGGGALPVESHYRFDSCLFAECVVQICSAWEEKNAEEDLGVPGKGNPGRHIQALQKMIRKKKTCLSPSKSR